MLVISVLAPSIEALCKFDQESSFVIDLNEEENKKESEKELDQNEFFFKNSFENRSVYLGHEITRSSTCVIAFSDFSAEVVLPPPQNII